MAERSYNLVTIVPNFKITMEQVCENLRTHKINKKEDQNTHFRAHLSQR